MSTLVTTDAPPADAPPIDAPPAKPEVCPYCGSHYQAGPEGPDWQLNFHCWSCGYNPGAAPMTVGGLPGMPVPGVSAAFAQQVAAQIREQLGLPQGVNLGDLLTSLKPQAQAAAVPVSSTPADVPPPPPPPFGGEVTP